MAMKILFVNSTCTYGSTGAIVTLLKEQLEHEGHDVYVCYGWNTPVIKQPRCYKITFKVESFLSSKIGKYLGFYGKGNIFSTWKLKRIINKITPDIINLFNLHSAYLNDLEILRYIGRKKIPTIYTMFDEYAYMGKCCFSYECMKFTSFCCNCNHIQDYPTSLFFDRSSYYFKKKKEIYDNFSSLIFVGGTFVYERSKIAALMRNRTIELIEEPIDYDMVFFPRETDDLRTRLKIPSSNIIILTIANYGDERKGGKYFFEIYDKMKDIPGYSFVFVGYDEKKYGLKDGVITIPYVNNKEELSAYYSLADVFVFTSLADTSPNTVQQALGCGSPVCAFDIEGITTMNITDSDIIKLSGKGNIEVMKNNILKFGKKNESIIQRCRMSVYKTYNISIIYEQYMKLYETIVKKAPLSLCNIYE